MVTSKIITDIGNIGILSLVPVVYKGKLYAIVVNAKSGISLVDIYEAKVTNLGAGCANALHDLVRILDFKIKGSTVKLYVIHIHSGAFALGEWEVALDTKSASLVSDTEFYTGTWVDEVGDFATSVIIPPRLFLAPEKNTGNIHYIDILDGTEDVYDTGFGTYFPFPSFKYVIKRSDIYMCLGRHLAGDPWYVLAVYGKTVTAKESTGGGSPRPPIGCSMYFGNDIKFPITSGAVTGSSNDIYIYDTNFDRVGSIDPGAFTGTTYQDPYGGFSIFAKKTDGGYYMILSNIDRVGTGNDNTLQIWFIELGSDFSIVSTTKLYEISPYYEIYLCRPHATDWTQRPIIDIRNKMLICLGSVIESGVGHHTFILYVDLKDEWTNIAEFNKDSWIIG